MSITSVIERMRSIRLIEKMEQHPVLSECLGLKNRSRFTFSTHFSDKMEKTDAEMMERRR